ncbi:MAG: hypothetical protein HOL31_02050 [Candidatus Scalindua sp.]|nr:hypothetical protein [Candidatus Scalindua sp.]MBT7349685.1 hypothetical protein [candidate division WWE3 bacterium]
MVTRVKDTHWKEIMKDKSSGTQMMKKNCNYVIVNQDTRLFINWDYYMKALANAGKIKEAQMKLVPFSFDKLKKFAEWSFRLQIKLRLMSVVDEDFAVQKNPDHLEDQRAIANQGAFIPLSDAQSQGEQEWIAQNTKEVMNLHRERKKTPTKVTHKSVSHEAKYEPAESQFKLHYFTPKSKREITLSKHEVKCS